jgi:hypothetical protein
MDYSPPSSLIMNPHFFNHFWHISWKKVNTNLKFSSIYHLQTNGQTKVGNRSLGNRLHCLVKGNIKSWDQKPCQTEFTLNHVVNQSISFSPFQIVYVVLPRGSLHSLLLPEHTKVHGNAVELVTSLQKVHETVHQHLEIANQMYKFVVDKRSCNIELQEGNLVWVVITKKRFLVET